MRSDGFAAWRLSVLSAACVAGCGYHSVYAAGPQGRLHVVVVRSLVADAVAADEVASGVREELVRAGALEAGEGYPRVEIEVLRADEASEGIVAGEGPRNTDGTAASGGGPVARGTEVGMTARAWIAASAGSQQSDTGDVRAEVGVAADTTARSDAVHHADALRAAARRLGHALGARLLGQPAASAASQDSATE
jgi:hypothetical protein